MMGKLFQLVLVLVAVFTVFLFALPVLAEDVEPYSDYYSDYSVADIVSLPGVSGDWMSSNYENKGCGASVFFHFEGRKYLLDQAGWTFNVQREDTSKWNATFQANGFMLEGGDTPLLFPIPRRSHSRFLQGEVSLDTYLRVSSGELGHYPKDRFHLWGSFLVEPAVITDTNGYYKEYRGAKFDRWYLDYSLFGEFLADTPEQAKTIGAQFLNSVPEPSTVCLLGMFALSGAVILFRRRYRKI